MHKASTIEESSNECIPYHYNKCKLLAKRVMTMTRGWACSTRERHSSLPLIMVTQHDAALHFPMKGGNDAFIYEEASLVTVK